jgi:gamma-tubulin complex component 3
MAEMVHFIRSMQAYCHLEVIECSWKILIEFLTKKEGDLDALIEAHQTYLDRMVKKVLLLSPKAGKEVRLIEPPSYHLLISSRLLQENLLNHVKEVFSIILQFRESTVSKFSCDMGGIIS